MLHPKGAIPGTKDTLKRLLTLFYWKGMKKDVKVFVQKCDVCHRSKVDLAASSGLHKPYQFLR